MQLSYKEIMKAVRNQLSIDLNCTVDDFDRDGFVFCDSKENPGRRPFPRGERHFEMLTMGGAIIVSATPDIMPYLKEQLEGKSRDDAFSMPFVYGLGYYFLPDNPWLLPLRDDIVFEFVERQDIPRLYTFDGFHNAIQYDVNRPRPDILAMIAKKGETVVGIAGASDDCEMLWQVGIDVMPEYRGLGIATILTNRLTIEILRRGKVPYYGTSSSNIASQRVAHRAGFKITWICAYRGRFDDGFTQPTG